jgi:hypothetical protein
MLASFVLGLAPTALGGTPVKADGIAVLTARFVAGTVEVDPVFGEAAGVLTCDTSPGLGGACFDLSQFENQGLFAVTDVFPDQANGVATPSTTLFEGFDTNNDSCVACSANDPDPAFESDGNGRIGIPLNQTDQLPGTGATVPLQVFVRAVSLHDDGALRRAITGTLQVTIETSTQFQQECNPSQPSCGGAFKPIQACVPASSVGGCQNLPYPYPTVQNCVRSANPAQNLSCSYQATGTVGNAAGTMNGTLPSAIQLQVTDRSAGNAVVCNTPGAGTSYSVSCSSYPEVTGHIYTVSLTITAGSGTSDSISGNG